MIPIVIYSQIQWQVDKGTKDKNDTWTDSSRRNNIWSSFSSTDLHLGFLHHLFNMSNHIHLTIHLNQYISIYQLCKTNPYLGPLLVSANCCWSSMNRFNLVHTACTFNTACTFDKYQTSLSFFFVFDFCFWFFKCFTIYGRHQISLKLL